MPISSSDIQLENNLQEQCHQQNEDQQQIFQLHFIVDESDNGESYLAVQNLLKTPNKGVQSQESMHLVTPQLHSKENVQVTPQSHDRENSHLDMQLITDPVSLQEQASSLLLGNSIGAQEVSIDQHDNVAALFTDHSPNTSQHQPTLSDLVNQTLRQTDKEGSLLQNIALPTLSPRKTYITMATLPFTSINLNPVSSINSVSSYHENLTTSLASSMPIDSSETTGPETEVVSTNLIRDIGQLEMVTDPP